MVEGASASEREKLAQRPWKGVVRATTELVLISGYLRARWFLALLCYAAVPTPSQTQILIFVSVSPFPTVSIHCFILHSGKLTSLWTIWNSPEEHAFSVRPGPNPWRSGCAWPDSLR